MITVADLPPPPPAKMGFPWTEGTVPPRPAVNYPKITVVTPSFRQAQFLEETIRSVLLQGYPNLEYIIIDGGSPDDSPAIIQKYRPFLAYAVSEKDNGQTNAINKGFAYATGEIMGWLNSDDVLMPGALLAIARRFTTAPQTQAVCGLRLVIDDQSRVISRWVTEMPTRFVLQHQSVIPQETCYWRKSIYDAIGPLDESFRFAMDYEYWQRMLKAGCTFTLIPRFLGKFRVHGAAKTSTLHEVMEDEVSRVYQMHLGVQARRQDMEKRLRGERHARLPFLPRFQAEKFATAPLLALNLILRDRYYKTRQGHRQGYR